MVTPFESSGRSSQSRDRTGRIPERKRLETTYASMSSQACLQIGANGSSRSRVQTHQDNHGKAPQPGWPFSLKLLGNVAGRDDARLTAAIMKVLVARGTENRNFDIRGEETAKVHVGKR